MQVRSVPQHIVKDVLLKSPSAPAWQRAMHDGKLNYGAIVQAPIYSLRTQSSISIGDFADVLKFAGYLQSIGVGYHQVLPPFKLGIGDICPYSAVSLKALEPAYISINRLIEQDSPFFTSDKIFHFINEQKETTSKIKGSKRVDYEGAMAFKYQILKLAFEEFYTMLKSGHDTKEAQAFRAFCKKHAEWLDSEYVPYMLIRNRQESNYWKEWSPELRNANPSAIDLFMREDAKGADFYRFEQWVAHTQWEEIIRECEEKHGVKIIEDIPYLPGMGASDVWANQPYYHLDYAAGAEPDQYAQEGQFWGNHPRNLHEVARDPRPFALPAILMAERGVWAGRADHTWGLADPVRIPLDETQMWKNDPETGRKIYNCIRYFGLKREKYMPSAELMLKTLQASGMVVWGEDLGVEVPGVRELMEQLGILCMPVERWHRDWPKEKKGQPFIHPATWTILSFGCSSVHDSTNHPFHLHELMEPKRYAPNEQALKDLKGEVKAYLEYMGWARMPEPQEMNDQLYPTTLHPILGGNSMLASMAQMDLWGQHLDYRDPILAKETRHNVPGTPNEPGKTENWGAVVPDLPEIMDGRTKRAQVIADGTKKLLRDSGRYIEEKK